MKVTALNIYPVKGLQGISLKTSKLELAGLAHDRRFMIVDEDNQFITQRERAKLATIRTEIHGTSLTLKGNEGQSLFVNPSSAEDDITVTVWKDEVRAQLFPHETNQALSDMLGANVRLVYMAEEGVRFSDEVYAGKNKPVSFADGFPVLVTNEVSLAALNKEIENQGHESIGMGRFRANIIIDGEEAWDEDSWLTVKIGNIIYNAVKPCTRCIVTTKDQKSGAGDENNQPIRTLTQLRRSQTEGIRGVLFGMNLVPRETGNVSVGDGFEVLERRDQPWPVG